MSVTVSVVVALWNAEATIEKCILSIVNQHDIDVEVVIVDDCSTDQSVAIVQGLQQRFSNLHLVRNTTNAGPSASRNHGIDASNGKWIAIVDSDDFIAEHRLSTMLSFAEKNHADLCFDNLVFESQSALQFNDACLISDQQQHLLSGRWEIPMYTHLNRPYDSEVLIGFLKPFIKRDFIDTHSIRYPENIKNSEDYLFVLECLVNKAKVVYQHAPNYHYFVNSSSLSGKFNPIAHQNLMQAELNLLEKYKAVLSLNESQAIKKHHNALKLAGNTNLIFGYLNAKEVGPLIQLLWQDKLEAYIHFKRIFQSLLRKISNKSNRGH